MEDFGFERGEAKEKIFFMSKKIFWASATLFSLACFLYITLSAYSYFYDDKNSKIETIKSDDIPLKSFEDAGQKQDSDFSRQIDRSIYEDIFGSKNSKVAEVEEDVTKKVVQPKLPPRPEEIEGEITNENNKKTNTSQINKYKTISTVKQPKRSRIVRVQIAAMTSKDGASKAWLSFQQKYPDLFNDLIPYVQEVDLGKRGVFYRLQAGEFFNQIEAENFCEKYVKDSGKSRSDCIIVE
ncbi:MAG: SPOR domain-containing protein [Rickettsiales bacterium]|nr:SPOR domain-containing protein [Rickettsiales bacterium]